ncbi:MAG: GGDEF domain-containing protein [Lachnotalea sp.]
MHNISFNSISDSRIPIAITDLNLTLHYGNKSLYTLIGNELFYSIYKVVLPSDRTRLTECIKNITDSKTITGVFSILYSDNEYHLMYLDFSYFKNNKLIKIKFQYFSDIINEHSKLEYEIKKYRTFFTLDGDNIFEYYPDTKFFKFYWVNNTQNIVLYNGEFGEWKAKTLNSSLIATADIPVFIELCHAIESCNKNFEYQILSSILSDGDIFESTKIKGITVEDNFSNNVVLGVWLLYNTIYNVKDNHFIDKLYKDEMTGLLNKNEMTKYVQRLLKRKPNYPIHIIILDLDNFKQCNDTYGHMFGDEILSSVAVIIKNTIQQNGVAGRIGGDEFLIALENIESEQLLRNMLRSIRANIQWLYKDKLSAFQLSCSIGVSSYPKDASDYDTLFKLADYSLYLAKSKGKSRYIIYDFKLHGYVDCNINDNSILTNPDFLTTVATIVDLKKNINSIYRNGIYSIPSLFETLKSLYNLHNISIYIPDDAGEPSLSLKEFNTIHCFSLLFHKEYLSQFNEVQTHCVTNIKNLEFIFNEIYIYFAEKSSTSFYQCLLTDSFGITKGIISYERSNVHNAWPNDIRQILCLVSSMISSVIFVD